MNTFSQQKETRQFPKNTCNQSWTDSKLCENIQLTYFVNVVLDKDGDQLDRSLEK